MSQQKAATKSIAIVDPRPDEHLNLLRCVGRELGSLYFVTSGHAALRLGGADGWIIHTFLPDMSGFDLCDMLRTRFPNARYLVIDDSYRAESERRARACGGAMYACKPLQPEWLLQWWQSRRLTEQAIA